MIFKEETGSLRVDFSLVNNEVRGNVIKSLKNLKKIIPN